MESRWIAALITIVLSQLSCAPALRSELHGEIDVATGFLTYADYISWPGSPIPVTLPLVMIVGPPGATACGLSAPSSSFRGQLGGHPRAPWQGTLDGDRSVTIALPSSYQRRRGESYQSSIAYQCRVISPEWPQGRVVTRVVRDVEFPIDTAERERRFAVQIEQRNRRCAEEPDTMRTFGISCDPSRFEYIPERRMQPFIVHIGDAGAAGAARWDRLRERIAARCEGDPYGLFCSMLTDGTWEVIKAADLNGAQSE